jgi:hypothetical protein
MLQELQLPQPTGFANSTGQEPVYICETVDS